MSGPASLLEDAGMVSRYAFGIRRFLRNPLPDTEFPDPGELNDQARGGRFIELVDRMMADPGSPYARLLTHAGVEMGDLRKLVAQEGVEATLGKLLDAGVYLRMDEFKGRKSVERPGLSFEVDPGDFDNPGADGVLSTRTGGTTGRSHRVLMGFDHLSYEAGYQRLFRSAFNLEGRPYVLWRPTPPGAAGLANCLSASKLGVEVDRWFSQNPTVPSPGIIREFLFTRCSIAATRLWGTGLPSPEHVPVNEAIKVAVHLARWVEAGTPALFNAPVSSAVRVCAAARQAGLDLSGTAFRLGGEPLSRSRRQIIIDAGCTTMPHYAMAETGVLGLPCAFPSGVDDVHLITDKLALIERPETLGGEPVDALLVTMLRSNAPKLMLNVDTGDCAVADRTPCGCPVGAHGYHVRLSGIRSYEKLTSEGMNYLHGDVIALVDEILPARFGGNPTDYQLLESQRDGLPRVGVVVSPRLGELSEDLVREVVLEGLGSGPGYRKMMSEIWEEAGTVEVVRREPYTNKAGKVLPLHFIR